MLIVNLASGQISMKFGAKGPNSAVATACATGSHAIGDAFKIIQRGDADIMIAGGTEAVITPLGIGGFNAMKALSTRNEEPEKASRPFDSDRDGFIMGEGAGIVILESLQSALKGSPDICGTRGIRYDRRCVSYDVSAPRGEGAARCMAMALQDAKSSLRR